MFTMIPCMVKGSGSIPSQYLDSLPVIPLSVWSMRRLISTATRSMRVRRSSDNTETDIGFTGDALNTATLLAFAGAGDAFVTTIYDQTSNAHNAVQTTAASQPKIVASGSVLTGITFDGTDDSMWSTSYPLSKPQAGVYGKIKQGTSGVQMLLEMSTNFNSNVYSLAFYVESSTYAMGMNSGSPATQKINYLGLSLGSTLAQATLMYDRNVTGDAETKAYQAGSAVSVTNVPPYTNDQVGSFVTSDLYIGARAASSLYAALTIESLVVYDGDSATLRSSIETIVA